MACGRLFVSQSSRQFNALSLLSLHNCKSLLGSTQLCRDLHDCRYYNGSPVCDITSSEALKALRPFYLAVHPDLFVQFPRERTTNENSLKQLNSYLDALGSGCGESGSVVPTAARPRPVNLTFFLRRKSDHLRAVNILLNAYSIGSAVHDILQSCDLFADISNPTISKLIETKHRESQKHLVLSAYKHHRHRQEEEIFDYSYLEYAFSERRMSSKRSQRKQPDCLEEWLKENLSLARARSESSRCLLEENQLLQENLCLRYGIRSIEVETDWTAATVKGHLLSLKNVLEQVDAAVLESWKGGVLGAGGLRFVLGGHRSHVSLDGVIHLSFEETRHQWMQYLMGRALTDVELQRDINSLEDRLRHEVEEFCSHGSGFHDLKVAFKRPTTMAPVEYRAMMTKYIGSWKEEIDPDLPLVTGVAAAGRKLDTSIDIVIAVTQAGSDTGGAKEPLLLEDGSLELPLSCSVTCLWEFLVQYCHRIIERRQKHESWLTRE